MNGITEQRDCAMGHPDPYARQARSLLPPRRWRLRPSVSRHLASLALLHLPIPWLLSYPPTGERSLHAPYRTGSDPCGLRTMADGSAAIGAGRARAILARGGEEIRPHESGRWHALSEYTAQGKSAVSAGYGDGGMA